MLSDEDRVVAHRGLLAVIRWIGGGETLLNEFLSVRHHGVEPLASRYSLSAARRRNRRRKAAGQPLEDVIQIAVHLRAHYVRLF